MKKYSVALHALLAFFIWCPPSLLYSQSVDSLAVNPKPGRLSLTQKQIGLTNSEEFVDAFYLFPQYSHLDLGLIGQVSNISYRGIGYKNVNPVFNGIKLESTSFGAWNLLDIPYFIIDSVKVDDREFGQYPSSLNPVQINTPFPNPDIPVSEITYRFGDFSYNDVNISLSRRFGKRLNIYAAGSKNDFPDRIRDNAFNGSNFWLNGKYGLDNYTVDFHTLVVDRDTRVPKTLPPNALAIAPIRKETSRSSHLELFDVNFFHNFERRLPAIKFNYWNLEENSLDSSLYNIRYKNNENVWGITIEDRIFYQDSSHTFGYHYNSLKTSVNSSVWGDRDFVSNAVTVTYSYVPEADYNIRASSELKDRSGFGTKLYGKADIFYRASSTVSGRLKFGFAGRFPSVSELYTHQNGVIIKQNVDHESINSYELIVDYEYENMVFSINPFLMDVRSPIVNEFEIFEIVNAADTTVQRFVSPLSKNAKNFMNAGFTMKGGYSFTDLGYLNINYTFLGGSNNDLMAGKHTITAMAYAKNLEDYITDKGINTELSITGRISSKRNKLNYMPFYRQFNISQETVSALAGVKLRGNVTVRALSFFTELDFLSNSNYQYVRGYRAHNKVLRFGFHWKFIN